MRVLVIGASGMLGNAVFRVLSEKDEWKVYGTIRSADAKKFFDPFIQERLLRIEDILSQDELVKIFTKVRPDIVINCVGLVKQLADADDPLLALPLNSLLPHRLADLCNLVGSRLIHISTDCVFSGSKGMYIETDHPDADDLYGRSKFLGEVAYSNSITLRTSIIGHELRNPHSLVDWFLSQSTQCKGYQRAIFSGLPTVVLAEIIRDVVIPNEDLEGLYHVAAEPISKYELLHLIASAYEKNIEIIPDEEVKINRSLNCDAFKKATGYSAPCWPDLIKIMRADKLEMEKNVHR